MDTMTTLNGIFCEVFDEESLQITRATTADDVDGWDSLSHTNLIVAVEMAFNVRFNLKDTRVLKDVGELVDLIDRKLAEKG
ncbi:acyl carrier protein [Geomonas propionica]|uniref:Acyl carrier protein n=1 Tax=Geomonas propionica TaxID=2798582 RepID=A0ABS0YSS3_9BACT|nr:acyl carrier protein [Geomonas propionica]MBJ6801029.1 acyl carrier protein [Geomonas propionica]